MPAELFQNPGVDERCALRRRVKSIAVVGLSPNPARFSYDVAQAMQRFGFTIIPVHPAARKVLGATAYPRLADISIGIDLVNVFRRPEHLDERVDDCLTLGVKNLWIQEGIVNNSEARRGPGGGILVVMDCCIYRYFTQYLG